MLSRRRPSSIRSVTTKNVPVRPDVVGELPNGLRLVKVSVEPKELTLAGARSALRNVREVLTDRVDLADLRETTTLESPVALGYPHVWRKDSDGPPIRVRVEIEPSATPGG